MIKLILHHISTKLLTIHVLIFLQNTVPHEIVPFRLITTILQLLHIRCNFVLNNNR